MNDPFPPQDGGCAYANWIRDSVSKKIPCADEKISRDELFVAFANSRDQGAQAAFINCDVVPNKRKLMVSVSPSSSHPKYTSTSRPNTIYVRLRYPAHWGSRCENFPGFFFERLAPSLGTA